MSYNRILQYANCKVAILEMMENPPKEFMVFKKDMETYFCENYESILKNMYIYKEFKSYVSCSYCGNFKIKFDYDSLIDLYQKKYNSLLPNQKVSNENISNEKETTTNEKVSNEEECLKKNIFNISNLTKEELVTLSDYGITKNDIQNNEDLASAIAIAKLLEDDENTE